MITYIHGDLFTTPDTVIVHGCNAAGVMGSGVAKTIKEKYPKAFQDYHKFCTAGYKLEEVMGRNIFSEQPDGKIIVNSITQPSYGRAFGIRFCSYDAIDDCMQRLFMECEERGIISISMPKIGAGLGGGSWDVIEKIIEQHFLGSGINVNVYFL